MPTVSLTICPTDAGVEFTREEFAEAEFAEGYRYERHAGKLVAMPPPGEAHHFTLKPFRNILGAYEIAHPEIVEHVLHVDGAAVVVHAGPDDMRTDPAGNSGDRVACGVVMR